MNETAEKSEMKISVAGEGKAGADYDPGRKKYHPITDAFWKNGDR